MRRFLALALLLGTASPGGAEPANTPPYASMRILQALQEQVAHGNSTAQLAQPKLMEHIAEQFLAADPAVWKEPRNARAAVLYLLSGGPPSAIRTITARTEFPADIKPLLVGALAYAEGQDEVARGLLDPIEPQSLPTALGSHLALIKAGLVSDRDPARAATLFDTARLLAPGTLIEEAALRREVFLLIDSGTIDKAMLLARQYVRRFARSAYSGDFRQRFANAAASMATASDMGRLSKLDTVLNELPGSETRSFYLDLARASVLGGKMAAARFAADKAIGLCGPTSAEAQRARLYRAAALVVSDDGTEGLAALAALHGTNFSGDDQKLRDAALAIGTAIQADSIGNLGTDPGALAGNPAQATIDRARTALQESDHLLQKAPE